MKFNIIVMTSILLLASIAMVLLYESESNSVVMDNDEDFDMDRINFVLIPPFRLGDFTGPDGKPISDVMATMKKKIMVCEYFSQRQQEQLVVDIKQMVRDRKLRMSDLQQLANFTAGLLQRGIGGRDRESNSGTMSIYLMEIFGQQLEKLRRDYEPPQQRF